MIQLSAWDANLLLVPQGRVPIGEGGGGGALIREGMLIRAVIKN